MKSVVDPALFMSKRYSGRKPSVIRKIISDNLGVPGMISLAGGLPNPAVFPITGLSAQMRGGGELVIEQQKVQAALQYSASTGLPFFVDQLRALQERYHSPPTERSIAVGTGSQSLLAQAFDMVLNEGDPLIIEAPTYPGALAGLQAIRPTFYETQCDGEGIIPSKLAEMLDNWDSSKKKPRVLYTIPTGHNPSGSTIPTERRKEIYKIAQKHNLLIIEDDPYYYLYLGEKGAKDRSPPKSFMSMDVDGRVLRFDSFSKVLSSGMRIGFMTAPPAFIKAIEFDIQGTALHTSNMGQVIASGLLEKWGHEGWEAHVEEVKDFYSQRRDVFIDCCEKELDGLATWTYPKGGMFVWFTLNGIDDTFDLILNKAKEQKVLFVPGQSFFTSGKPSSCVRASFSVATDEQMQTAMSRFATLIRSNQA
eukprot:TRINITY_DN5933_c0_g1_i1.p1 TRINITY_DN5933_c0_g1~~TRINITY_DN5933_c0_g1_i1.p1  ORF type:complete len:421 (+),score=102.62 TRINITY_DN5933_c0_g1_i1:53-1315(+)